MEYLSIIFVPIMKTLPMARKCTTRKKGNPVFAAVRMLFKYLYKKKIISADPASLVDTPKIHEKAIVRLDVNEMANFLDAVESGEKLTDRQKVFHEKTKKRDLAMMTLLLGTGMRVSECVGINIKDLDFQNNAVKVTRKGGNEVFFISAKKYGKPWRITQKNGRTPQPRMKMRMPSFFRVRANASACGRCRIWSKNTHRALQSKKSPPISCAVPSVRISIRKQGIST